MPFSVEVRKRGSFRMALVVVDFNFAYNLMKLMVNPLL
jgi:hypothetical protein